MVILRVLLVAPSLRFVGGQSAQAARLREDLSATPGLEVGILHVDPTLGGVFARLQRIRFLRTIINSVAYLIALIRTVPKYDVVHAYSASYWSFLLAPVPALVVGRLFGKRTILNYHSGEAPDHLARWGWHARPLARLASLIVVPSPWLAEVFERFELPAYVIQNSLDLRALPYRRRLQLRPRFLSNRSFEAHYNVRGVLDAFAVVQAVHPDAMMTVAGDGPLRHSLEAHATSLGLQHVRFVGACDRATMYRLYDEADVLLNGSLIDNLPLTLIEAFAAGLPVVTSDAGGIPLMLGNGAYGTMVAAGDATALGQAVLALLSDSPRASRLAESARDAAFREYTWDAVRTRWLWAYGVADMPQQARPAHTREQPE